MKHLLWILLCPVLAFAQVTPTIPTGTVLGNSSGSTAAPGAVTTIPTSVMPGSTGDCSNAIASTVIVCTQASGNFSVGGTLSPFTLGPPTNVFIPPEIDFTAVGTSGVVLVNGAAGAVTTGTYTSVSGTGGTGSGVVATVVATAGVASSITITTAGTGYSQNDALSFVTGSGTATGNARTLNNPTSRWNDSGATVNYGNWECHSQATAAPTRNFICGTTTDTFANERQWLNITGTGTFGGSSVLTALNFGNGTDNPAYNFLGTGTAAFGGAVTATTTITPGTTYVHGTTVLCSAYPNTTSGSVLTEVSLGFCTIPAGSMGTNGVLRITVTWQHPSTAVAKTYNIRFTSTLPVVGSAYSTGTLVMNQAATVSTVAAQSQTLIRNLNVANSQFVYGLGFTPYGAGTNTTFTPSQNTALLQYVALDCIDASSNGTTETCGLLGYTVELVLP